MYVDIPTYDHYPLKLVLQTVSLRLDETEVVHFNTESSSRSRLEHNKTPFEVELRIPTP